MVTNSSCSKRLAAEILVDGKKNHNEMENLSKVELGSSGSPKISGCNLDGDVNKVKDEFKFI